MLKTFWFLIKISVIVGALLWIALQSGPVSLSFLDYDVKTQLGVFLLGLMAAFFICYFIIRTLKLILSAPKAIADNHSKNNTKRGYQALTQGMVAVAAGDSKAATKLSKKASNLIGVDHGLPVLLEAQAARLRGDTQQANECFIKLSENKETSLLGVRGLLRMALDEEDYQQALTHAKKARDINPKQEWISQAVYDLEIKNRHWKEALKTIKRSLSSGFMPHEKANSDRIAINLELSDQALNNHDSNGGLSYLKRAYKLDNSFVPSVTRLAKLNLSKKNRSKAVSLVLKCWKENPHPDLAAIWQELSPELTPKNRKKYMAWFEKLLAAAPESDLGMLLMAQASMDIKDWQKTIEYLKKAKQSNPSSNTYKIQRVLREHMEAEGLDIETLADQLGDEFEMHNTPERCWVCSETGRRYDEWTAIARPHGSFNTIIWDYAQAFSFQPSYLDNKKDILISNEEDILMMGNI